MDNTKVATLEVTQRELQILSQSLKAVNVPGNLVEEVYHLTKKLAAIEEAD